MNCYPARILFCVALVALVSGCKLNVVVPVGGSVEGLFGSPDCQEATVCEVDVPDPGYIGVFNAVPRPGYVFVRWQAGDGFLCGDATDPTCNIVMNLNPITTFLTASRLTGYIMPVFEDVGIDTDNDGVKDHLDDNDDNDSLLDVDDPCPLNNSEGCLPIADNDTVVVDGKTWAQPDLFSNLSWDDINAVCPAGAPCGANVTLSGYDMAGWTWASADEVNALFNHYLDTPQLGPGPSYFQELDAEWALVFFASGFRDMGSNPSSVIYDANAGGWINELRDIDLNYGYFAYVLHQHVSRTADNNFDEAATSWFRIRSITTDGAWFHRP